jgi:hypothetical protein
MRFKLIQRSLWSTKLIENDSRSRLFRPFFLGEEQIDTWQRTRQQMPAVSALSISSGPLGPVVRYGPRAVKNAILPQALFSSSAEPEARRESNKFSYFRG